MGRETTQADATDEMTAKTACERIATRLDDGDTTEVTDEELFALGVYEDSGSGFRTVSAHERGPMIAEGHKDGNKVDYYLVHVDQTWLNLLRVRGARTRDGFTTLWTATGAGELTVTGRSLQDGWSSELDDFSDETLSSFEEAYREECEMCFEFCTEMRRWAFDGSSVFMESSEPWRGWDEKAAHIGVEEDEFWDEIQPAIAAGLPNNPRHLDSSITAEYVADVEVGGE